LLREIMKPKNPMTAGFWDLIFNENFLDVFKLVFILIEYDWNGKSLHAN
jgi:hypothetical protein